MNADLSESFGSELVILGAADDEALVAFAEKLIRFLDQAPGVDLRDVAFTCAKDFTNNHGAVLSLIARGATDLRGRLVSAVSRIKGGAAKVRDKSGSYYFRTHLLGEGTDGRLAFVYPGAASFYTDMLRDLTVRFRECRIAFDELEAAMSGSAQFQPSTFIFPPAPYYRGDADVFSAGAYAEAVVSVITANMAMTRFLESMGIKPDGAVGFAGGDLNALVAGGLFGRKFDRKRRLDFFRETYKTVNTAVSHSGLPKCVLVALLVPHADEAEAVLQSLPAEKVQRAFHFSPKQWLLAVAPDAAEEVEKAFDGIGIRTKVLEADRPFNTSWCKKVLPVFNKLASKWIADGPQIPVYSCGTADVLPQKTRKARDVAAEQWIKPVHFADTISKMWDDGFRVFLETGPRGVMPGMIDDVLRGKDHVALSVDSIHRADLLQLQHTLGSLAALGASIDPTALFAHRRARILDFDSPLTIEVRREREMPLSREFPKMMVLNETAQSNAMVDSLSSTPTARRNKTAERAAAAQARARKKKQFEYGAILPLISNADIADDQPGIREIVKTFSFREEPFLADFALGSSQLEHKNGGFSNDQSSLRALVLLHPVAGAEIMAEVAQGLMPGRHVVRVEDMQSRRRVAFKGGKLRVFVRAERIASDDPALVAVRVQLREDAPGSAWTWPVLEATFMLSAEPPAASSIVPPALSKPRDVHWTRSDIYPERLFSGSMLQGIRSANRWSEVGLDYEVEVPAGANALTHTNMPVWTLNPLLLSAITDGFALWRSHERFPGAFSFPFRIRKIVVHAQPAEGARLHCYLRNTGVTPNSLIVDVLVSDGNGKLVLELRGYEELTERVPDEYRKMLLSPVTTYLTQPLANELLGSPSVKIASAVVTDVPYKIFERNEEIWLNTLSHIVLNKIERSEFADSPGSASRRTEWLFGRIAAKEAVRRFLQDNYQARWCPADVQIWRDDSGKPHPIGTWKDDYLTSSVDLAIAHTAQFVVAVVAANARVGVDVESRDRDLSEEFTRGVFTPEELELVVNAVNAPSAIIRFWCAKEAVSKALGTGIRYSPRELIVDSFRPETGEMGVKLTGQWLEPFRQFTGRIIPVSSSVVKGHVLASCYIPESMFA